MISAVWLLQDSNTIVAGVVLIILGLYFGFAGVLVYQSIRNNPADTKTKKEGNTVNIDFDVRLASILEELKGNSGPAEVIGYALQTQHALYTAMRHGLTQVILRNPKTGEERTMTFPALEKLL